MRPALVVRICICTLAILVSTIHVFAAGTAGDGDNTVVYTAWTPSALVVAFHVDDADIVGSEKHLKQPWLDDAIAVYLNFGSTQADRIDEKCLRVVISAADGIVVQRGAPTGWRDDPPWLDPASPLGTIRCGVKILGKGKLNDRKKRDEGYDIEIGLLWRLLGVNPPFGENGGPTSIGFAAVRYDQVGTRGVDYYCWPKGITIQDMDHPSRWGTVQLLPDAAGTDPVAVAPHLAKEPVIQGEIAKDEWAKAGQFTFGGQRKAVVPPAPTPIKPGKQLVSVVAAWYVLDPFAAPAAHQPFDLPGLWAGPDSPLYHQMQLRDARQTGIDALAMVLPVDPRLVAQTRVRLTALAMAMRNFSKYSVDTPGITPPLLLPVIDLSAADKLEPVKDACAQSVTRLLADFYYLFPPQHRLMVANHRGQFCYPIVLASPTINMPDHFTAHIDSHLQEKCGAPIGWIVDDAMGRTEEIPNLLSTCALNPPTGLDIGRGPLLSAVIMPGYCENGRDVLLRCSGETYGVNWQKLSAARPDFVLIRSWNDFNRGSEIAPSRLFGYRYAESTQQEILRLAQVRGFGITVLNHTLPPVLLPGRSYSVEVLVKNGSLQQITAENGCQVDYRISRKGNTVLSGMIDGRLQLREFSTTRLQFTLTTGKHDRRELTDGEYALQLDFGRNKIAFINSTLLRDKLGTLTFPFAIGKAAEKAQVMDGDFPVTLPVKATGTAALTVRNVTKSAWKKGAAGLRFRWSKEDDLPLPDKTQVTCEKTIEPGETVTIQGTLPPAPDAEGWYYLIADMPGKEHDAVPVIARALVHVIAGDLLAEFRTIAFQRNIEQPAKPIQAQVLLHNRGGTAWTTGKTRLTYQWLNWNGQPIPEAAGSVPLVEDVAAGARILTGFTIMPPAGAGSFRCAFGVTHGGQPVPLISDFAKFLLPAITATVDESHYRYVSMMDACKVDGADTYYWAAGGDQAREKIDFDGTGRSFPLEEFLPDATFPPMGYQPGYDLGTPAIGSPGFFFSDYFSGKAMTARANRQEIALSEKPAIALHLAATCTATPHPVDFLVRYTDGTEQRFRLTVANWLGDPVNREPILLKTRHLHTKDGDDWTRHGSVFVYTLALDPTHIPAKLILPQSPDLAIFAATLELKDE